MSLQLTFDEYQFEAFRTVLLEQPVLEMLTNAGLGLTGEAGEVADLIKKVVFHAKPLDSETRLKLQEELGDVLWYIAQACYALDIDMQDVANHNNAKLRARFPNGYDHADAKRRADEG